MREPDNAVFGHREDKTFVIVDRGKTMQAVKNRFDSDISSPQTHQNR